MKKTVTIKIEVDLDTDACKEWAKPNDFFIDQVDTVLEKLSSIRSREYSRYASEEGTTDAGSKFKIEVKKINKQ
jgi:hypothetical protein